ncbi:MAG: GuaB3 family IMP dehydrogenase-related protein [bacterium JZ-2024 1]
MREIPVRLLLEEEEVMKGRIRERGISFDEISLLPGAETVDPADVELEQNYWGKALAIPFLASAMDSVVNTAFAKVLAEIGGMAVLNLQGLHCRYEDPEEAYEKILNAKEEEATRRIQEIYARPLQPELIQKRIQEWKKEGIPCAVSLTPAGALEWGKLAQDAGAEVLFLQSTVTSPRHYSSRNQRLDIGAFIRSLEIPVVVGNCVSGEVAYEFFQQGAAGILVGIGPGAACTTRLVTGVGLPQVSALLSVAHARDVFFEKTGVYVPVICDGGMRTGGDVAKALACGSDLVMMGAVFARCREAAGGGYHWGMATGDPTLPRGMRIYVGRETTVKELLLGPSSTSDGTLNLVGAVKNSMGLCGAKNLAEFHRIPLSYSPSLPSEGRYYQWRNR